MSKLDAALAWAARGFPVFPLVVGGKEPAFEASWYDYATMDATAIRAMWTDPVLQTERDYNIGVDCTNHVVVDIDVKDGKDGYNQYMQLGGTWETLCVRTPSGGYHLYFEGPDSSNAKIAKDIDIRSHHGYVLAPGSYTEYEAGKSAQGWYELMTDRAPAWVPYAVEKHIRPPYERSEMNGHASLDSPASIEGGIRFAQSAPPAIQGQRGDEATFIMAARLVREFALSEQSAFDILRDHWNERCSPPWSLDELARKVENAGAYATAELGRLDPSVLFSGVAVEPPPSIFEQSELVGFGNAILPAAIRPRPWLLDRMLMEGQLTALIAPGSAGKSSASLVIAAHAVLGIPLGPHKFHRKCKVIVYNGEDNIEEQSRRLLAVCLAYHLDYNEVKKGIMLLSSDDVDLKLASAVGRTVVAHEETIRQLNQIAIDNGVGLIIIDPLVDIHEVDEQDNPQMNMVMKIAHRVAKTTNAAILLCHHTTKGGTGKQEERVGNMDIARGAGGIIFKVRLCFTLLNATATDAEQYGLQDHERNTWVRLDDAKMNYTLAAINEPVLWFHKEGVKIASGDIVGVLHHMSMQRNAENIRVRVAELLITHMQVNNQATLGVLQAVGICKEREPLWAGHSDTQIRQKLDVYLGTYLEVRGTRIRLQRDETGKNPVIVIS